MKELILVGGGGHARSLIDVIELTKLYKIVGIIDTPENKGTKVLSYEINYSDEDIPELIKKGYNFIVSIGQIKSPEIRIGIYDKLKKMNAQLPMIISPLAYVSKTAQIGEGTVIMHGAIVNVGVKVGVNCIINSKSLLEHDAIVEDHCHISTGAILNGGTIVKSGSFIGSNAVIREYLEIKSRSVIPAGAVILRSAN